LSVRRRFIRFFAPAQAELDSATGAIAASEHDSAESARLDRLDEAIAALPAFYKEPLLLTTVSGLSQQQAAEQLRTTPKAIEMRIRRARKNLSEALARPGTASGEHAPVGVAARKK
jgi:RNA polymerase sigma-70 factor (ECF subfamily)